MRRITTISLLLIIIVATSWAVTLPTAPRLINYQGRLTDAAGTPLPDGAKSVRFIIWNDPTLTAPGNEIWNSGPLNVTTTNGLFSVLLGASPQPALTPDLMMDTLRWMGITIGADPELSPRARLVSVPYAFNAQNALYADSARTMGSDQFVRAVGDTMVGDLSFDFDGGGREIWLYATMGGGILKIADDGANCAAISGDAGYGTLTLYGDTHLGVILLDANRSNGGYLYLNQQDGTSGLIARGGTTSSGSTLHMYSAAGANTITLDADGVGNSAAALPANAIAATEILNEPGIAAANNTTFVPFNSTEMTDVITVTITTPASGYIVVEAKTNTRVNGTRSSNYGYLQIDETAAGSTLSPYMASFGPDSSLSTGLYMHPAYLQRIYYKTAGTYTFRLEGMSSSTNGAGAVTACYNSMIMAQYFPTSYGTVETVVGEGETGGFDNAAAIRIEGGPILNPAGPQTKYLVDLRELELKAARAQAEAERAERELAEARLQREQEESRQVERPARGN